MTGHNFVESLVLRTLYFELQLILPMSFKTIACVLLWLVWMILVVDHPMSPPGWLADSNPQPHSPKPDALPTELFRPAKKNRKLIMTLIIYYGNFGTCYISNAISASTGATVTDAYSSIQKWHLYGVIQTRVICFGLTVVPVVCG